MEVPHVGDNAIVRLFVGSVTSEHLPHGIASFLTATVHFAFGNNPIVTFVELHSVISIYNLFIFDVYVCPCIKSIY